MGKIRVNLKKQIDNSYDIIIGENLLNKIPKELKQRPLANKYIIITDSNGEKLYGNSLLKEMKKNGLKTYLISFKAGEKSKTRKTKETIENRMMEYDLGRDTLVIAVGGGVVGDIAGFVAATYYRGISYIQVPTTLLAFADSSIGGKTAVDTGFGKNLIGAFHQPKRVYIDTTTLKTLPKKEMKNGIAETIKHAVIKDKGFFRYLEKNVKQLIKKDPVVIEYITKRNCEIKAKIVEMDEKEKGQRKILNYGHTIGHAIEAASNYKMTHGNAVALGMVAAAKISIELGYMSMKDMIRQNNLIEAAKLPVILPDIGIENIIKAMQYDKKIIDDKIMFVLPKKIGDVFFTDEVSLKLVKKVLDELKVKKVNNQ
ncbi:MAG: 3-dehydroquinate synthase [Gammaproteobacteria bacterium]|nr:3-dehydroquinate synthase [Gammaproteobacteria bacterium]